MIKMYGPPLPFLPNNVPWNHHPEHNPQWRPNFGARVPFGHRPRFNVYRPPLQQGNDNFWCETCDRGFPTEDIMNRHKQQHQKCNIDGCQFIAHPKVITKHIQMQHSTGIYKKIANINKPEEIEKWREERRKRYPTKANIDKKAAILHEKIDRGEKMGLDKRQFNQDSTQGQGVKRKNSFTNENHIRSKFQRKNDNPAKRPPRKTVPKSLPLFEDNRKLKPFAGIANLDIDSDNEIEEQIELNDLIEDDECEEPINETINTSASPVVCGALSSLMCDYGSSDEDNDNNAKSTIATDLKLMEIGHEEKSNQNPHSNKKCNEITSCVDSQRENSVNMDKVCPEMDSMSKSTGILKTGFETPQNNDKGNNKPSEVSINHSSDPIENNDSNKSTSEELIEAIIEKENFDNRTVLQKETVKVVSDTNMTQYDKIVEIALEKESKSDAGLIIDQENDEDSGPEEVKVIKNSDLTITSQVESPKATEVIRNKSVTEKKRIFHRPQPKLPSTLLHKLLFREMQQERNIVLQCIRYIRKNNYFDKK